MGYVIVQDHDDFRLVVSVKVSSVIKELHEASFSSLPAKLVAQPLVLVADGSVHSYTRSSVLVKDDREAVFFGHPDATLLHPQVHGGLVEENDVSLLLDVLGELNQIRFLLEQQRVVRDCLLVNVIRLVQV